MRGFIFFLICWCGGPDWAILLCETWTCIFSYYKQKLHWHAIDLFWCPTSDQTAGSMVLPAMGSWPSLSTALGSTKTDHLRMGLADLTQNPHPPVVTCWAICITTPNMGKFIIGLVGPCRTSFCDYFQGIMDCHVKFWLSTGTGVFKAMVTQRRRFALGRSQFSQIKTICNLQTDSVLHLLGYFVDDLA